MGEAKRRGTFEQHKAQRLSKQYGMTNHEIAEAYRMNRRFRMKSGGFLAYILSGGRIF